jgi:hypothetical protein
MSHPFSLPQQLKLVIGATPAADAAGRTATYVSLKNAHKAFIVIQIGQGNAATVALTPFQAKNVAALSEKVLAGNMAIYANLDAAASDLLVRQTDAVNFTTDAGLKNKVIVFEIDPASLDVNNGFDCITIKTGASNAANITSVLYVLGPHRYPQASLASAILD